MSRTLNSPTSSFAPLGQPFRLSSTYDRVTGLFRILEEDDENEAIRVVESFTGYAGYGFCRNDPECDDRPGLGPLPGGHYTIGLPHRHPRLGPIAFRLTPKPGTVMKGRSGFYIHGDNAEGDASRGCIILTRRQRDIIAKARVRSLTVF